MNLDLDGVVKVALLVFLVLGIIWLVVTIW
jgi:hypothetical protein